MLSLLRSISRLFTKILRVLVKVMTVVAALGIMAMLLVTCIDVILRAFNRPLIGALDIVRIASVITIAAAMPYTTALKGHVAVEYCFHKLSRRGRIIVDTIWRIMACTLFGCLTWQCLIYAASLKKNGTVTPTLQVPLYWIPYVLAFSCGLVGLVILHNMLHPGQEMIKP